MGKPSGVRQRGDPGGPPWYHNMYDWFQETKFALTNKKQFITAPNRGSPTRPCSHQPLGYAVPPTRREGAVNSRAVLDKRSSSASERGLAPTSSSPPPNAETYLTVTLNGEAAGRAHESAGTDTDRATA
jgi:hypothetical protein